jgi:hypothetical protein
VDKKNTVVIDERLISIFHRLAPNAPQCLVNFKSGQVANDAEKADKQRP